MSLRPLRLAVFVLAGLALAIAPAACTGHDPDLTTTPPPVRQPSDAKARPLTAGRSGEPRADKRPVETIVHGQRRVDEYAWLRNRDDPDVIAHLEAENRFADRATAHTKDLQERLYNEILARIKQTDLSVPYRKNGYLYYSRTVEGQDYPILARKPGAPGAPDIAAATAPATGPSAAPAEPVEEVMLDLNALADGKEYFDLGGSEVSPDNILLAYSVDLSGSEKYDLFVKNLATGKTTGPIVSGIAGGAEWGADNQTLFYSRRDASQRPHQVWRHTLGTDAAQDVLVYDEPDPLFFAFSGKSLDEQVMFLVSYGKTSAEWRFIPADQPTAQPKLVAPRRANVLYSVAHHPAGPADPQGTNGGTFFILTDDGAPNFKLVVAPASDPGPANWKDYVGHDPSVYLDDVEVFRNHLVLSERRGGFTAARVLTLGEQGQIASERVIELPEKVATIGGDTNAEFDATKFRFGYTSYLTPSSVYDYDMNTGQRTLLKQQEVLGGYDPAQYESGVTYATATDGTQVPVSFVHRKGLSLDGRNPTVLYGYGSYGASEDPYFSGARLSLLDRGVVWAVAHVRGGGEMGRAWKEGGRLGNKANTFTDFIAAAEHLVAEGYTNPDKLAIEGGSAGGLLVGAAINMRPELFEAAVAQVPFVDVVNTMLDPTIPLTTFEYEEWGNPADAEAFAYMLSYSPYDNVKAQAYPHLLIMAGLNDPRVGYWEPAKWAARLRDRKQGDSTLILKTEMGAGHGGPSGRYDAIRETAFEFAFILDRLGVVDGESATTRPATSD